MVFEAEVALIEMIVLPKLTETIQMLKELINDLQYMENETADDLSSQEKESTAGTY